jgi:hypothetical protein
VSAVIVPAHWAEARAQHRTGERQITIRRFGWSDVSQEDAQAMADARAGEALQQAVAGQPLIRREPKVPYNGAVGVPIREEIVERYGATVITRNSYGARCLNTPNVLFADVDATAAMPGWLISAVGSISMSVGAYVWWRWDDVGLALVAWVIAAIVAAVAVHLLHRALTGGVERRVRTARRRVARWVAAHRGWSVRIYRTPSGLRVMATHQTFSPGDPQVTAFFRAIRVDKVYARMCANQQCFRARLTPKPWRIGIAAHMKPRPGVWPIAPERRPIRDAWIANYEAASRGYAACRFLEAVGTGATHIDVELVRRIHDDESRALQDLPIA